MILYLAGSVGSPKRHEDIANKAGANSFLFTFYHKNTQTCAKHFCTQPQRHILIDSGAFSAWTKGKPVDLDKYIDFCKQIMSIAKCSVAFAALDVIPGKKDDGGIPSERESERACEEGWANYQSMKQEGIHPCIMTFHQYDNRRWLTRLADDCNYFAIAPRKRHVSDAEKLAWLHGVFKYIQPLEIINGTTRLKRKIHGLGVSSVDWMKLFPFFSVDNTDWLQGCKGLRSMIAAGRPVFRTLKQWERLATKQGMPISSRKYIRKMLGYGVPGVDPDETANSGSYWLMLLAMHDRVELERLITKHWRDKGLLL